MCAALMFSATFRKRVERVARDILTDPLRVVQGETGEVGYGSRNLVVLHLTKKILVTISVLTRT